MRWTKSLFFAVATFLAGAFLLSLALFGAEAWAGRLFVVGAFMLSLAGYWLWTDYLRPSSVNPMRGPDYSRSAAMSEEDFSELPPHPLDANWFIFADDKVDGPHTGHQLKVLRAEGRINAATQVVREGTETWKIASEDPVLHLLFHPFSMRSVLTIAESNGSSAGIAGIGLGVASLVVPYFAAVFFAAGSLICGAVAFRAGDKKGGFFSIALALAGIAGVLQFSQNLRETQHQFEETIAKAQHDMHELLAR